MSQKFIFKLQTVRNINKTHTAVSPLALSLMVMVLVHFVELSTFTQGKG